MDVQLTNLQQLFAYIYYCASMDQVSEEEFKKFSRQNGVQPDTWCA